MVIHKQRRSRFIEIITFPERVIPVTTTSIVCIAGKCILVQSSSERSSTPVGFEEGKTKVKQRVPEQKL